MATDTLIDGLVRLTPPTLSQSVHREECTQCFDNQVWSSRDRRPSFDATPKDDPLGIDVCLTCFNGGCLSQGRHHAHTHSKKEDHQFALNIKRRPRPKPKRVRSVPLPLPWLTSATG